MPIIVGRYPLSGDPQTWIELNAATRALVRVISGPAYQLNGPDALLLHGTNLWVANAGGESVTAFPVA
jgi:hypothetical protein